MRVLKNYALGENIQSREKNMSDKISGGCLCGAVKYSCTSEPFVVGHCHCVDCRKSSGSGHGTHVGVMEDSLSVSGSLVFYEKPADSGNVVSRGFCSACGVAIYSTNSGMPGMVFLRASSLDDPDMVQPQMIVYASRAPAWDHMDPALPSFPEMPPQMPEEMTAK